MSFARREAFELCAAQFPTAEQYYKPISPGGSVGDGIHINLAAFNRAYQAKFILADMPGYCRRLMEQLEPVLKDYLRECKIAEYTFRYIFHHNGNTLERYTHITCITT